MQLPWQVANLIHLYEPDGHRNDSKRVILKELTSKTLKFIKERPYISRLHTYNSVCPVLKLIQLELNE
jgi:hypothetical protein